MTKEKKILTDNASPFFFIFYKIFSKRLFSETENSKLYPIPKGQTLPLKIFFPFFLYTQQKETIIEKKFIYQLLRSSSSEIAIHRGANSKFNNKPTPFLAIYL